MYVCTQYYNTCTLTNHKIQKKATDWGYLKHIEANGINENFQSAYKFGHSCETALIRVYNDIVTPIGKGNGSGLV